MLILMVAIIIIFISFDMSKEKENIISRIRIMSSIVYMMMSSSSLSKSQSSNEWWTLLYFNMVIVAKLIVGWIIS
ncbi:hypothetical protein DERF_001669 [Dermatophagoides farinae]|uniref:Uncharacterized protein n=1 Tax=Dermatophagoides farinae TaxID=6954 RepID=A0A922I927_DERFA|nr:hypothetical protein DERF_001669 [Dermatophagoides farinae]